MKMPRVRRGEENRGNTVLRTRGSLSGGDMNRVWRYRYGTWTTEWYHYLIPQTGMVDETGRRTIVIHVPLWGFVVWAYRTCHCEDCDYLRAERQREQEYWDEIEEKFQEGTWDAVT